MMKCPQCKKEVVARISDYMLGEYGVSCGCSKKMGVKSAGIKFNLVRTSTFEDSGKKWGKTK